MKAEQMTTSVIIPTYNEKENLEPLVEQLLAQPLDLEVVVVDDNSPDGTGEIADRLAVDHPGRVQVVHRAGKLGLGTAYIAGFRKALEDGADLIVTMDADFSHPPEKVPELAAKAGQGYDLVIGSRYVPGGQAVECTLPRKMLSWGANTFARTLLGLKAHDTTAGFRCYRRAVLGSIALDQIFSDGYSFLIEMLYKVQRQGWRVGEVPIVFHNRQQGVSKISRNEVYKALYTVVRLFGDRLLPRRA
ncbi:MAG: polyprenol monophosphomannose synthase [Anaerolineae bacterium]